MAHDRFCHSDAPISRPRAPIRQSAGAARRTDNEQIIETGRQPVVVLFSGALCALFLNDN